MKFSQLFPKIFKWLFRGGLIGLPLALSSTLAWPERLTWIGAVLLWFYTGRIIRQREQPEDDSTAAFTNQP